MADRWNRLRWADGNKTNRCYIYLYTKASAAGVQVGVPHGDKPGVQVGVPHGDKPAQILRPRTHVDSPRHRGRVISDPDLQVAVDIMLHILSGTYMYLPSDGC